MVAAIADDNFLGRGIHGDFVRTRKRGATTKRPVCTNTQPESINSTRIYPTSSTGPGFTRLVCMCHRHGRLRQQLVSIEVCVGLEW